MNLQSAASPFDLTQDDAYRRWRDRKLSDYPTCLDELVVEVRDPRALTWAEHEALLARCRKTNMALYASAAGVADKEIPAGLGCQFGLEHLDHNWLADDDAITSLTQSDRGARPDFIPYTDRPIHWHTDGYYNAPDRQIRGLILHCVHPAAQGGGNALLDHEMVYMKLRDEDPSLVAALMEPDAMTIPARTDSGATAREARPGPVFSVSSSGDLHMRYTARKRNIEWKGTPEVQRALKRLEAILATDSVYVFRGRLESGMGLLCNNVLHDRSGFDDVPGKPARLLYRARYYDRIRGTGLGGAAEAEGAQASG